MSFDRMGRRVEYLETVDIDGITTTNTHHRFLYDGYLCIQRLNAAANNSIDLIIAWDPSEPVATRSLMIEKPNVCMLHVTHDGNKNVSDLVFFNGGSGVAAHYEYATFGALTASTRNSTSTAFDFRTYNPFRFSSEYADDALGTWYGKVTQPADFHWYRQDTDASGRSVGTWSSKGGITPIESKTDPVADARKRGYTIDCGYLCFPNSSIRSL